jgi:hypothetical protein
LLNQWNSNVVAEFEVSRFEKELQAAHQSSHQLKSDIVRLETEAKNNQLVVVQLRMR